VPLTRRLVGIAAAAAAAFFTVPAAAGQADVLAQSSCTPAPASPVFLPWGDPASYALVPGGDMEGSLAGWTLAGGAAATGGSETYGVTGSVGSSSLSLPAGAGALSPVSCVNVPNPSVELFTRSDTPGATLTVWAVLQRTNGNTLNVPVGSVSTSSSWQPSGPLTFTPPQANKNGNLLIALAFQAVGGSIQVDDTYVDPWIRCC